MGEKVCTFCDPEKGGLFHFHADYGLNFPVDRVSIIKTSHFIAKPDILPLEPDGYHALIIPQVNIGNEHPLSFAALQSFSDEVGSIVRQLEGKWGNKPILLAEHGAHQEGGSIQSVYHAHTHAFGIPGGINPLAYMKDELARRQIKFKTIDHVDPSTPNNLKHEYKGQSYLYLQYGGEALIAHDPEGTFPSQITQRAMSRLFNGDELNWKSLGRYGEKNPELAKLAIQRSLRLVQSCLSL